MKTIDKNEFMNNFNYQKMNYKKMLVVFALVFGGLSSAHAESILLVGDSTVVTNINGQKIASGFFSSPPSKFNLPAGTHKITAKYERLYDLSKDNHDILRSVEITLPVTLEDNSTYTLDMINQPEKYKQAVKYAEKPTLGLMNKGKVLAQKTAITGSYSGFGGLFNSNDKSVTINTTANNPAATPVNSSEQVIEDQTPKNEEKVLDNFMKMWLKATPAERQKIKDWVKDQ